MPIAGMRVSIGLNFYKNRTNIKVLTSRNPAITANLGRRAGLDSPADEQPKNVIAWIEEIYGTEDEANLDSFCSELNQLVERLLLLADARDGRNGKFEGTYFNSLIIKGVASRPERKWYGLPEATPRASRKYLYT